MSTDLERYVAPPPPVRLPTFEVMGPAIELAAQVANTDFVPKALRGKPEAVVAAILQGHELGIEPMASLAKIHIIEGRPSIAAELMRALVQRAGHEIWLEEASNTKVTLGGRRRGEENATRITWTADDAKRARLDTKQNWRSYPRAMLVARATGELCRLLFADVLAGISYASEEVRDGFDLEEEPELELEAAENTIDETLPGRPADVAPPPAPTTTRTASTTRKAASTAKKAGRRAAPPAPAPPEPEIDDVAPPTEKVETGDHVAGDTIAGPSGGPAYSAAQALAIRSTEVGLSEAERHGLILAYTAGRTGSGKDLTTAEIKAVRGYLEAIAANELEKPVLEGEVWIVRLPDGTTELASDEAEAEPLRGPQSDSPAETPGSADEPGTAEEGPESTESGPNPGTEPPSIPDEPEFDVDGDGQGPEVPDTEDAWRVFLRGRGLKVAEVLRSAAALAVDPKAAPASLSALAQDPELGAKVVAWAEGSES